MKIIVSFNVPDRDRMERALKEIADEFMEEVAKEILTEAKYNMLEDGSIVTGKLEASGYVKKIEQGDWEVGFSAPYAGFVEYGTGPRAKLPPVNKLAEWAKIKFGLPFTEARRVAWAVAHWIKEHGTKPHPFFRPAIYKVVDKYKNLRLEEKEVK